MSDPDAPGRNHSSNPNEKVAFDPQSYEDIQISELNSSKKTYNTFDGEDDTRFDGGENGADDFKKDLTYTMQEALDYIGFGPFQIMLSFFFGLAYMAESMELMLVSVLLPVMRCVFKDIGPEQLTMLPLVAFLGILLSGGYWGKISDTYGRKTVMIMSSVICSYFGVLSAFSPTYFWIIFTRILVSFSIGASCQMVSYYAEFLPTKSRSTCVVILALIWALGACLEVAIAMATLPYLRWRLFLVLSACPVILFVILGVFIPESPRHLIAHRRYDEAMVVLRNIARMNKKPLPDGCLFQPCHETLDANNLADIFVPKYLKTTLLLTGVAICSGMSYYGTALLTTTLFDKEDGCHGFKNDRDSSNDQSCIVHCHTLTQDDYFDLFLASLGDAPGVLVCIVLMAYFGRKASLGLQMAVFTLATFAINFCAPRKVLVGLFFLARAMADGFGQGLLLYITEVYPTSIRAIGMGWAVSFKGIGSVLSAISANILLEYSSFLAISALGVAGFINTVCVILLPYETRNRNMLDTIKENAS